MKRLVGCFVISLTMASVCAWAQNDKKPDTAVLENGHYDMSLTVKGMVRGKDDVTLPAHVNVEKGKINIKTHGMLGNKFTLSGLVENGDVKVGMTDTEKGNILSFHYVGKIDSETKAHGTLFCFADGVAVFSGQWTLTKKVDALAE